MKMQIGMIGLGRMMASAAKRLLRGGHDCVVHDLRRAAALAKSNMAHVDVGTSGGLASLERGGCRMIGGAQPVVQRIQPVFTTLAPGPGTAAPTPVWRAGLDLNRAPGQRLCRGPDRGTHPRGCGRGCAGCALAARRRLRIHQALARLALAHPGETRTAGSASMTASEQQDLDQRCISTLRALAIDQVQKAHSGHPGTPMGAAPTAYCLWQRFLRFDPEDAALPDRDRFVLSVGHASALIYALLYLCGVKAATRLVPEREGLAVTMTDLRSFRQAGSRCTGHPEHGWTTGVETTTGPLGQGLATSVGMAIAQAWLAATYNRPGFLLVEHRVFALTGDGDMMEGLSAEAASLAGHLELDRLCWIYDSNQISIEGANDITFTENVSARFTGCGWQVLDANDIETTALALRTFKNTREQPILIIVHSHIGYEAPHKQDSGEARSAKQFYGFDPDASFAVPEGVREHLHANFGQRGTSAHKLWRARFAAYRAQYPDLAEQIDQMQQQQVPEGWDAGLQVFKTDVKAGHAGRFGPGAQRHRGAGALAAGRCGRSGAIDQDHAHSRFHLRFRARIARWAQLSFWCP
jgi:transketolase N-terminal domain/subunit